MKLKEIADTTFFILYIETLAIIALLDLYVNVTYQLSDSMRFLVMIVMVIIFVISLGALFVYYNDLIGKIEREFKSPYQS
jgi:hypothetical protein